MNCPFCLNPIPEPNPGETICPNCRVEFEIDDRGECVFPITKPGRNCKRLQFLLNEQGRCLYNLALILIQEVDVKLFVITQRI